MNKLSMRALVAMLPALMLTSAAGGQENGNAVVTAAVQVTANPNPVRAHATPLLARNPKNGELVIAEVDVRGSRECAVHISTNDGRSWFPGGDVHVKPFTDCSIGSEYGPHVMPFFDRDGVLYVVTTANDPKELFDQSRAPTPEFPRTRSFVPRNVYLSRSTDGGRTFDVRLAYQGPRENPHLGYNYAPVGAVDPENPRNVYIGWTQGEWQSPKEPSKAVVSASSDGGRTFAPPHDISQLTGSEHPWISVGRGGIVHASHWSKGFGKPLASPNLPVPTARQDPVPIFYVSSRDKGRTWDRMEVDPGVQSYYRPPVIAADPNSDAVYMVWYSTVEPRNFPLTGQGADRTEIFLRASLDGGKTWGERRTVNDDAGKGANHSLPGVSIAPNGRVDIAWSDSRNNPRPPASPSRDQGLLDIYYASSDDQGRTFTPSQKINDRAIDRSLGVWSNNVNASVATGMASTDSGVYLAWQDARAGANQGESEDVYFATLKRDGSVLPADEDESVPAWLGIGAGIALGLGIGMVLVWVIARRNRPVASGLS
ncbi:MAG TPA: sialidase family protein [Acidimicrobiales bacterium]|nr:sialidase family protein [Acidimicrobiales bacterium]